MVPAVRRAARNGGHDPRTGHLAGLGREREEGIALSDLGLLAYLAYDHPAARSYYDQALTSIARPATHFRKRERSRGSDGCTTPPPNCRRSSKPTRRRCLSTERLAIRPANRSRSTISGARTSTWERSRRPSTCSQQALALRPPDRYPRGAANVLIRIGLVYLSVAEWQRALDVLQQARALARAARTIRGPRSTTLVNLGSAYVTFGDTSEALRYLEPALATRTVDRLPRRRSLRAAVARRRRVAQRRTGAQPRLPAAGASRFRPPSRTFAARPRRRASWRPCSSTSVRPHDALASITRSIEISPQAGGLIYTGALTLANVYAALGDAAKAQAQYEEALGRFRRRPRPPRRGARADAVRPLPGQTRPATPRRASSSKQALDPSRIAARPASSIPICA